MCITAVHKTLETKTFIHSLLVLNFDGNFDKGAATRSEVHRQVLSGLSAGTSASERSES